MCRAISLSVLAVVLTFLTSASAQTPKTNELPALQAAFDTQLKKINDEAAAALQAWPIAYAKELDALQARLQKAGDLNGWETATTEAARFKADPQLTEAHVSKEQPDLQALQEKYCAEVGRVTLNKHRQVLALRSRYVDRINVLQRNLTTAGRMEAAKAARAEITRVAALPEVTSADFAVGTQAAKDAQDAPSRKKAFEADYAPYDLLARNPKSTLTYKSELEKAWRTICSKWNVANPGVKPGALVWNDAEGRVQIAPAGATPVVSERPPVVGQPWVNSLGMEFLPVPGTDVLFCKWETRVQDYDAFAKDAGLAWRPDADQGPTNPAVNMSWDDAQAFCKWLTEKEHTAGTLQAGRTYRLPQDWEWSVAVGLKESKKGTPAEKSGKIPDVYPWGNRWPPPKDAGNYGPSLNTDSFEKTSAVGSFKANKYGLFDMGGNVWEWCEDFADGHGGNRALRGGAWDGYCSGHVMLSNRRWSGPGDRGGIFGFRCVVVASSR